jgi:ABC-type transporter Mla subunit MlaD
MNADRAYFRLGLFILLGVGLLVAGVIVFGSAAYATDSLVVETVTLESVLGLDVGAPVKFRGVQVGRVRKIDLAVARYGDEIFKKNIKLGNAVILELALNPKSLPTNGGKNAVERLNIAVAGGLRARMTSSGLTGPPLVELVFLNDSKPIELVWKPEHPYIPAGQGTFTQFVDTAGEILEGIRKANVGLVITHADELFVDSRKAVNDLQVAELRGRAVALLDELRGTNKRVREILDNPAIEQMIKDGAETMASAKGTVQSPELKKFVADLPEISSRLRSATEQLDKIFRDEKLSKSLDNLAKVSDDASVTLADIRRLVRNVNGILGSEQQDLEALIVNLRRFAENAAAVTEDARNNPSRLLFGEPPKPVQPGGKR